MTTIDYLNKCHFGDCIETMRGMPAGIVQTCVTSPPYFGLRSYLPDDHPDKPLEIGKEKTPDEFVAALVAVFREVRRVLADDGTLFLNIGDSYSSSARRAAPCGTSGKAPANSPVHDCLCGSLCDGCRKAYRIGKSHSGPRPAPTPSALSSESIRERKESELDHLPTLDSARQAGRISNATQDQQLAPEPLDGGPRASQASTSHESSQQHQDSCLRVSHQGAGCQLCGRSLLDSALASSHKAECSFCTDLRGLEFGTEGMGVLDLAYPYSTSASLKNKDLIGIPWMLAFALRADGWILRQEIIWAKPNPMPESVLDRCTKSHESIFLLAKSEKYYFDAGAIKEPAAPSSIARWNQDIEQQTGSDRVPGKTNGNMKAVGGKGVKNAFRGQGHQRDGENGPANREGRDMQDVGAGETRNKRSVWTVATTPYKGAHFATFPTALIEPCILAGAPAGGVVLDPFGGSGTTAQVAQSLGRKWILCELNEAYRPLIEDRTVQPSLDFQQPCDTAGTDTLGFEVDSLHLQSQTIEMV